MDIVDRIDALAKKKGWPRNEVFRRVGLNPTAAQDWRRNRSSPEKHIENLAGVLNTSTAYLRGDADDPRPEGQKELDELEYAMLEASRDLTDAQKRAIIQMIKAMKG